MPTPPRSLRPPQLKKPAGPNPELSAPAIESWKDDLNVLPSLCVLGASGTGKTDAIAKLHDAGFSICYVDIENKRAALNRLKPKPLIVDIGKPISKRLPTDNEKWTRLLNFKDALRRGEYRVHPDTGQAIDILALDGLTEVADLIAGTKLAAASANETIKAWGQIARESIDFFKALRDASGAATAALGLNPVAVIATCLEASPKKMEQQADGKFRSRVEYNIPILAGNQAPIRLAPAFEVVFRLSASGGEFHVHTQADEEYTAKAPPGIFDAVVSGPGGKDNEPHIGRMYRELLTNENSPYYQGDKE